MNGRVAFVTLGLAGLAASVPAGASTVYDYTAGEVYVTSIKVGSTTVFSGTDALALASGSTATLDSPSTPTQLSFAYGDQGGSIGLAGSVSFTGSGGKSDVLNFAGATFTLSNSVDPLSLSTISPVSLTSTGGSSYSFSSGLSNAIQIGGTWSLTGATLTQNGGAPTSVSQSPTGFGPNDQPLSGTVGLSGGGTQLSVNSVTLGTFTIDGQTITVTGDAVFNGMPAVPLPAPLGLLGSGLALLRFFPLRRRKAS
jgi:hypothetical protein